MGGWVAIKGDIPDFDNQLSRFKRIFSVDGVPDLRLEHHQHAPRFRTITWAWDRFHVPDVYVQETNNRFTMVLCGVITDLGIFGKISADQEETAAKVLKLWIEHKDKLIHQLNGSFSIIFYDALTEGVTSFTDRFASRSTWFTKENNTLIFANFPSAIAAIKKRKPQIDPAGLWSLFNVGRHVGWQGIYDDVNCLMAGEKMSFVSDRMPFKEKWHQKRYCQDNEPTIQEWGFRIAHALKKASLRYKKTCLNPYIFLSGGLDSRVAAAAIGKPLKSISLCTMPNAETKLASMVSKVLGIDNQTIIRTPHWYLDTLDAAALISSGNYFTRHSHFIVPASEITAQQHNSEFFLGDLLENFNKHYFSIPPSTDFIYNPQNIRNYLHSNISYSIKNTSNLGRCFRDGIRQRIDAQYLQSLQDYAHSLVNVSEDDADRMDTFLRWANVSVTPTYNMIACLWPLAAERNIYFDNDVDKLSLQIPSRIRGAGVLHRWTLHYLNKILTLIPNANTFMPTIFPASWGVLAKKGRPFLGRIKRRIVPKQENQPVLNTSGSWILHHEMYRKDSAFRQRIEEIILNEDIISPEIFNMNNIKRTWHEFLQGNIDLQFEIDALLSFGNLNRMIPGDGLNL